MTKRFLVGSMLAAFLLAAGTVRAQGVDQKIQALEQELMQLKEQQVELKKEATAAVAAMPTFEYRPGSGVRMEAADKAWSLQLSHEIDWLMAFESGQSHGGRPTGGQVMTRRFRQEWTLCIDNCFYEVASRLDLDGWGTQSDLQRAQGLIHFENLNPWLPTLYFGGYRIVWRHSALGLERDWRPGRVRSVEPQQRFQHRAHRVGCRVLLSEYPVAQHRHSRPATALELHGGNHRGAG